MHDTHFTIGLGVIGRGDKLHQSSQPVANTLDPTTGEPIVIETSNMTLVTTPARNHAARRILNATEFQVGDGASGGPNEPEALSPGDDPKWIVEAGERLARRWART